MRKLIQTQKTSLYTPVGSTTTTFILSSLKKLDGTNYTPSDIGDLAKFTLDPGVFGKEEICTAAGSDFSWGTDGLVTITNVNRGRKDYEPYDGGGFSVEHDRGAEVVFGNNPQVFNDYLNKYNDETVIGKTTFPSNTNRPLLDADIDSTDDKQLITRGELNRTTTAGAPNASTSAKGIVELTTTAELDSDNDTGGTGAKLVPTPANLGSSKYAEKILVRAQSTPSMVVSVPAFRHIALDKVITFAGSSTSPITAPTTNPRIDLVVINSAGSLAVRTGTESASPVMPTPTNEDIVLGSIYLPTTATGIFQTATAAGGTQAYIQQISPVIYRNNIPTVVQSEIESYTGVYKLGESMTGATTPHPVVVIDDLNQPYHSGRFAPFGYEGSIFGSNFTAVPSTQEQLAIRVIPRTTVSVSKVFQFLAKSGGPSDGVQVEIQSDSAGSPSNTPITNGTSSTVLASSIPGSQELSYQTFTFSTPPTLTAGTAYWFVYKRTGALSSTSEYYLASTYPSGSGLTYASFTSKKNRGGTWSAMTITSLPYLEVETTGARSLSLWKSDANASFPMNLYYGFCTTTGSAGDSAIYVKNGKLGGFSSLSTGADYFVSNTSGTITISNEGTYVGTAVSSTEISIPKSKIQANFTDNALIPLIYFEMWNLATSTPNNIFQKLPFDCHIVFYSDYSAGGYTEIWVNKGSSISSSNLVTRINSSGGDDVSGTITVSKGDIWTLSSHPGSGSSSSVTTIKPIIN